MRATYVPLEKICKELTLFYNVLMNMNCNHFEAEVTKFDLVTPIVMLG
jgi:hypothetical protein